MSLVVIFLFLLVFIFINLLLWTLDKIKNNLRGINIKNHYTCYYFDNIIKTEDFDFDDCLRKQVLGNSNDEQLNGCIFY